MSSSEVDRAKQQFGLFLGGTVLKNREKFEGFCSNNSCMKHFSLSLVPEMENFNGFGLFVKLFSLSWTKSC